MCEKNETTAHYLVKQEEIAVYANDGYIQIAYSGEVATADKAEDVYLFNVPEGINLQNQEVRKFLEAIASNDGMLNLTLPVPKNLVVISRGKIFFPGEGLNDEDSDLRVAAIPKALIKIGPEIKKFLKALCKLDVE